MAVRLIRCRHAKGGPARGGCPETHCLWRVCWVILTGYLVVWAAWVTPAAADTTLHILQLNDTHGRSQSHHYAREAALIESLREEYRPENCVLVHAGDLVSKGNMFTAKTKGQGEIAYLNELGLDVWTLGNGDLGLGRSTLTPSAGLVSTCVLAESYSESPASASAGAMRLEGSELWSLRSMLGANLTCPLNAGRRAVVAEAQGGWLHEYLDEGLQFQATFLEYSDAFILGFGSPDRDAAYFGTGLSWSHRRGTVFSLNYIGLASAHNQSHTGVLHLGIDY